MTPDTDGLTGRLRSRASSAVGRPVSVEAVLSAIEYWAPSKTESADWLYEKVLPSVRNFLERHVRHSIIYGCMADFLPVDGEGFLDWLQIGFMPAIAAALLR